MRIVITKIEREVFSPKRPVRVELTFFDNKGRKEQTQVLPAYLFEDCDNLVEQTEVIVKMKN